MSMYYDGQGILSRNAMFNMIIGGRSTGKTYWAKTGRIKHFLKTGKQFIYLRRYKSEFDDKQSFFNDIVNEFPGYEFKVEGMKGYIRKLSNEEKNPNKWQLAAYFVTLANALTKKSVPYPDVDWIIFDEFIIVKGHMHYMPHEVKSFLDFYNTVDRFQDRVKVAFIANAVSIANPYFIEWKLRPRKNRQYTLSHNGYFCLEMVQSEAFKEHVDNTRFGKMIKETAYYDYAVSNTFQDNHNRFISKKSKESKYTFSFVFDGKTVGVWIDYNEGKYYICNKVPKDSKPFVLTKEDLEPNLVMIERSSTLLKSVKKLYMQGCVFFDSVETREFFNDVLTYLNLR